jgi:hypothetical protein
LCFTSHAYRYSIVYMCKHSLYEAYQAFQGHLLRSEVYALDKTKRSDQPYEIGEHNYQLSLFQYGHYFYAHKQHCMTIKDVHIYLTLAVLDRLFLDLMRFFHSDPCLSLTW